MIKKIIDKIYKVNEVSTGYYFWAGKLIEICTELFTYYNLPSSLPYKEIEYRIITTGHAGILDHPKYGIVTCDSTLYNYDLYGNYNNINFFNPYKDFNTGFNPLNFTIGKDAAVIYNGDVEKKLNIPITSTNILMQYIQRYARLLADLESTINIEIITSRQPYVITAQNQQSQQSFLSVFRSLKQGNINIPIDGFDLLETKSLKNKDLAPGYLNELLEARNTLLQQFLQGLGIYSNNSKKERLIVDEVELENRNVEIFIESMLNARKEGVNMVNNLFGTSIIVELNKNLYGGVV